MYISLLSYWIKQSTYKRPEICKILGVSQNTLSNWCTGKTYPNVPQLLKLCEILNVKVEDLYKLREEKE
ncbi:helix-turn-helix transcriptional regulator [Heyndrickxia oleronia]|uniref:helix-turn-helix transcriptional regulator n=1 Tax=Heyndrickxia oleronia TaxID=38875 RepID=UPI00333835DA